MKISAKVAARKEAFLKKAALKEPRERKSKFNAASVRQIGNRSSSIRPNRMPSTGPSPEELHWRQAVLLRDGYKCVFCGSADKLEADHIKPRVLFPELRLDLSNGRTLCKSCHKKTPTYGSRVRRIVDVLVEDEQK